MKKYVNILSLGLLALVVVEIVSDIAFYRYHIGTTLQWLPNLLIYFATAYAGARRWGFKVGVFFAALLGAFDGLMGWVNDNYVMPTTLHASFAAWIITMLAITLLAILIGAAAAALAAALNKRKRGKRP